MIRIHSIKYKNLDESVAWTVQLNDTHPAIAVPI